MSYKYGTRIPIEEKCVLVTTNPFWKRAEDIQNKVETRSMENPLFSIQIDEINRSSIER